VDTTRTLCAQDPPVAAGRRVVRVRPIADGRKPKAALLCGLAFFTALQLGLAAALETACPHLLDPEYGHRLTRLRARLAESPGRPLLLALGSSRVAVGFRPDAVPSSADAPVVFNFGLSGAGASRQLLCLERLRAEGVRPRWLVVEVMPALLFDEGPWAEEARTAATSLAWNDLSVLQPYWSPGAPVERWLPARLNPWSASRFILLSHYLPAWLPHSLRQDGWRSLDSRGWWPQSPVPPERDRRRLRKQARKWYGDCFLNFQVSASQDQALRRLLSLCRDEGIAVLLLVMPEGDAFRGWYTNAAWHAVNAYLDRLRRDYAVPVVDARIWVEEEDFLDSHHLLPEAAAAFSERLGRDVLLPWVAGQPVARIQEEADAAAPH
jgi:hypothetical protein